MSEPVRVLFVCTANICRSPYMEMLATHLADGGLDVSSAGTHGFEGRPMDLEMTRPLLARDVPSDLVEQFRSRPLTADLVAEADVVLTAEASHRRFILEEQPGAVRKVFTLGQFVTSLHDCHCAVSPKRLRGVMVRVALQAAPPFVENA